MPLFYKIIIILIAVVLLLAVVFLVFPEKELKNLSGISDSQIISLLNKNPDAKDYIQKHPDFKINKKEVLTKESILAGQNGQNFKEVYAGLNLEENRYLKVDLMNVKGDRGLVAVLDFKTMQTIKAYGIILLGGN